MYAVITHSIWSTPFNSPTIVGSAALSTVELSAARNIASISPTNIRMRPRLVSCDARAGALVLLIRVVVMGVCGLPL